MLTDLQLDNIAEIAFQHLDNNRVAAAVELYSQYLRFRPDDVEATYHYGDCLRMLGRYDEAEKALLKVLYSHSKYSQNGVRSRLAMLYNGWGKFDFSEQFWKTASEKRGTPGWAWIMRGVNLAQMGRFEEAESCYRNALLAELCDRDEAYLNLGYVLRSQRRYGESQDAFRAALEITPDYPEAIEGLRSLEGIDTVTDFHTYES